MNARDRARATKLEQLRALILYQESLIRDAAALLIVKGESGKGGGLMHILETAKRIGEP